MRPAPPMLTWEQLQGLDPDRPLFSSDEWGDMLMHQAGLWVVESYNREGKARQEAWIEVLVCILEALNLES